MDTRLSRVIAAARFLGHRLSQERITHTAASLTFTTIISVVPWRIISW